MPEPSPNVLLPPPGEVRVIGAAVQRVSGGGDDLTGISWNAEGHLALSVRGDGVRLLASPAELRALASVLEALADAVDARDGRPVPAAPPVPTLPPAGQVLHINLADSALDTVRQLASDEQLTGAMVAAPGALILASNGHGLRLRFRDRSDVARMITALVAIDAHLAGVEAGAASALDAALAEAREAPAHD